MKIYKLAMPKLVAYSILFPLIPSLMWLFWCCILYFGNHSLTLAEFIGDIVLCSMLNFVYIFYFRSAYCLYKITPQGLSNRYITIDWADVTSYKVYSVKVHILSRMHKSELMQVCVFPCTQVDSYRKLNPRECVFFAITKSNIRFIDQYCINKNNSIKDLIQSYS